MTHPLATPSMHDERGAALILVIGFMLMVGAISAGLLGFINTSVSARPRLDTVRNRQYEEGSVRDSRSFISWSTSPTLV